MSRIFFSYSREDSEFVLRLASDVRAAGEDLWLDQLDIRADEQWDIAVEKALASAECLIVVLSPNSVASNNVMDEVSYAIEEGKQVVPVLQSVCKIPFRLRRVQYLDFTSEYGAGLEKLLGVLKSDDDGPLKSDDDSPLTSSPGLPVTAGDATRTNQRSPTEKGKGALRNHRDGSDFVSGWRNGAMVVAGDRGENGSASAPGNEPSTTSDQETTDVVPVNETPGDTIERMINVMADEFFEKPVPRITVSVKSADRESQGGTSVSMFWEYEPKPSVFEFGNFVRQKIGGISDASVSEFQEGGTESSLFLTWDALQQGEVAYLLP